MFDSGSEQEKAALRLLAVSKLINQAVGDALSGLLLVEAVLRHMGWSIHRWSDLYQDLPSRQIKVSFLYTFYTDIHLILILENVNMLFLFCTIYELFIGIRDSTFR